MVTKQQEPVIGRHNTVNGMICVQQHKTANGMICVHQQQNIFKQESVRSRHLQEKTSNDAKCMQRQEKKTTNGAKCVQQQEKTKERMGNM
eukprot:14247686-Ditylum_brightwellii.AAC.1